MVRTFVFAAIATLLGFVGVGFVHAEDRHLDGHAALKGKLSRDGKHLLHKSAKGQTLYAHVKGGKVKRVEGTYKGKGLAVKKFKSARPHARADKALTSAEACAVVLYIGFGFYDEELGQWIIFWLPIDLVDGGDDDSAEYDGMR